MMACRVIEASNTLIVLISYSEWFLRNGIVNIEKQNKRAMSFIVT